MGDTAWLPFVTAALALVGIGQGMFAAPNNSAVMGTGGGNR
jgi:hypothetical protein